MRRSVTLQVTLALCICLWTSGSELDEKRLHHDILEVYHYSNQAKPPVKRDESLVVKLGLRLSQLLSVDQRNQVMIASVWLRQEWTDSRLKWDPAEYGGINFTHIPSDELWKPDIVLYNNADGSFVVELKTKARVDYKGKIVWEPPAIYKSYCPINVEYFPFDLQECFLKFSCWSHPLDLVNLQPCCREKGMHNKTTNVTTIVGGVNLKDYEQNMEWDILNVRAERRIKKYPCCPELYPHITFYITLRRKTLFYTVNLIIPCIAISCLTVLVFFLPSDSFEKITLSISILLALMMFFLLLSDINPPTSLVIPLIGKYLLFTMVVVTMSILFTVYTLNVHFRGPTTHKMPSWVKHVFTIILPKVLIMERPKISPTLHFDIKPCNGMDLAQTVAEGYTEQQDDDTLVSSPSTHTYENIRRRPFATRARSGGPHKYPPVIMDTIRRVKYIAQRVKDGNSGDNEEQDWKYVAMVMDRLFLYIFSTACLTGTMSIFLYAPSLYDSRPSIGFDPTFNCIC